MTNAQSTHKLVRQYKSQLLITFNVLLLLSSIYFFYVPKIQDIISLGPEIEAQQIKLDETQAYASYLRRLADTSLVVESSLVHYALPSRNDVVSLIVTYEGLDSREGIVLAPFEMSPGLISQDIKLNKTPTSLANGTTFSSERSMFTLAYPVVMPIHATATNEAVAKEFIQDIHHTLRALTIRQLTWNTEKDGSVGLEAQIEAYYFPPSTIEASSDLVLSGKNQTDFLAELEQLTVYTQYVLNSVAVGKEDLFVYSGQVAQVLPVTPVPNAVEEN